MGSTSDISQQETPLRDARIEEVDGYLINTVAAQIPVRLGLLVETSIACDDRHVTRCELLTRDVPNGTYALEYDFGRPRRLRVLVESGGLTVIGPI
ncbi:MAG TPA: hypothetical protein VG322_15685 [Candidatus Acidoferrales bacterium]|jgi:hypothetical protein|nr:hypothetical protein [Candidatus Acidoferrales bacterium]